MDRREESTPLDFESDWPSSVPGANAALPVLNGRWTFVQASLAVVIICTGAWLSWNTIAPVSSGSADTTSHGVIPYRIFEILTPSSGTGAPFERVGPADHGQSRTAAVQPEVATRSFTLDAGETLAGALETAGIPADDANAAMAALTKVYSPRSLRAGTTFEVTYDATPDAAASDTGTDDDNAAARLLSIRFSPSVEHDVLVARGADGTFAATDTVKQLVSHVHRAGATIDGSLYLSAMRAGIPAEVVVEMIRILSYKVDFQRDLQPGDSFEVFYDYYYTPEGQPAKQGNIAYTMMNLRGRQIALYRYQPDPNQPADYFDASGQSAKGMLMKTPVDGARITSGFGMRYHPVLGYTRMHKGVDFGVPVNTPVMAAGGGTIAFMGWESGYGNFVLVNHGNGYSTAYGHLKSFALGLHRGSPVRQAQVIAYSGNTGLTTGPHLHYEIRINNQQVNPLKVKVAEGRKLSGSELRAFQAERMHIDNELVGTKLETKVADASAALRQTN